MTSFRAKMLSMAPDLDEITPEVHQLPKQEERSSIGPVEVNSSGALRDTRGRPSESEGVENLLLTFEMFSAGVTLIREKVERENPGLSLEEVSARVTAEITNRPPDAPGRLVTERFNGNAT